MVVFGKKFTIEDIILGVLYGAGGEIVGKTRLQKIIFLLREDMYMRDIPKFSKGRFGPYLKEIDETLEKLESKGLISTKKVEKEVLDQKDSDYAIVISLTKEGVKLGREIYEKFDETVKRSIKRLSSQPLFTLISYVYTYYPEYAEKSEVKEKFLGKFIGF